MKRFRTQEENQHLIDHGMKLGWFEHKSVQGRVWCLREIIHTNEDPSTDILAFVYRPMPVTPADVADMKTEMEEFLK